MNSPKIRLFFVRIAFGVVFTAFAACQPQHVILTPAEDDLVVLNGCVISACNYLAAVKTQHTLEPSLGDRWNHLWVRSKCGGFSYPGLYAGRTHYRDRFGGGAFQTPEGNARCQHRGIC